MNLNSQFSYYPPQPDNPSDSERHFLSYYALAQKGRPEDFNYIMKLMSPPPAVTNQARPGEFKGLKAGIIGGGLAGLAAAFELRKLGLDITVFEALEDRIGGRVYTYYFDKQKALYGEFGPMRIPVSHETVWHYLKLFNLPTRPFIQFDTNAYVYLRNVRVRNDANGYNVMRYIYPKYSLKPQEKNTSWQNLLYLGTDSHLLSATPEERTEILQVKPFYNEKTVFWDENTNRKMMEIAGLSQDAINLASNFLPLLQGNLYNSYIDFIEESYPASLSYLYEIPGGTARLPQSFYNSLMSAGTANEYQGIHANYLGNVSWKQGCWVTGIHFNGYNKKVKLKYLYPKTKDSSEEEFDYVVCTIPFSSLRNIRIDPLFSNIKMRAIKEVNYCTAQKTLILCNQRFWERDGIVGGASITDLPVASIVYPSDHAKYINNLPFNEPGVMIGSFNFNLDTTRLTNLPEELSFAETKREIEKVHGLPPGYLDNIVEGFKTVNWDEQPTIRGSICFFTPEQKRIFSYGMALPEYNERIFFAGEHISAIHRWIQGALQSGMQAASDLAAACKSHKCM